jgi:hypothetical protein
MPSSDSRIGRPPKTEVPRPGPRACRTGSPGPARPRDHVRKPTEATPTGFPWLAADGNTPVLPL